MYISRFQLSNYKSFRSPPALEFTQGFNIIAGQNNAGKTALLEALGLAFSGKPHRSLRTVPARDTVPDQISWADVQFTCAADEVKELMLSSPQDYQLARPDINAEYARRIRYREHTNESAQHLLNAIFSEGHLTFKLRRQAPSNHPGSWTQLEMPSFGLYPPARNNNNYHYCRFRVGRGAEVTFTGDQYAGGAPVDFGFQLGPVFARHVYRFSAERLKLGRGAHGAGTTLAQDASNLPEVLNQLQDNMVRFSELNAELSAILPQVRWVSARGTGPGQVEVVVWCHDPKTKREDLAVPLAESGTGIGQVLAVLYVVMTSERPQVIIIDEPQSFLHPGAARKLIDFLRGYPQHQFIIATHSATIIAAANPQTITLARFENSETVLQQLDAKAEKGVQAALSELGVRLADSFGADNILWVEGRTEEKCFPIIIEKMLGRRLMGTEVLSIRQTGDLEGRDARKVFEIYNSLTNAASLLPPAVAFILDQECRDEATKDDLRRSSRALAWFLPRRMYENYLLNPFAITTVVNSLDGFRAQPVVVDEVRALVESKLSDPQFYCGHRAVPSANERLANVDGARVLERVFSELSDARVPYEKVPHGVLLTECLVEYAREDLREVANLLSGILGGR